MIGWLPRSHFALPGHWAGYSAGYSRGVQVVPLRWNRRGGMHPYCVGAK